MGNYTERFARVIGMDGFEFSKNVNSAIRSQVQNYASNANKSLSGTVDSSSAGYADINTSEGLKRGVSTNGATLSVGESVSIVSQGGIWAITGSGLYK